MAQSILQDEKKCFVTGITTGLHKHHIYMGHGLREISEENGFWVYLIEELHNMTSFGVHGTYGHSLDIALKQICQAKFEETHTRDEFIKLIGVNFL